MLTDVYVISNEGKWYRGTVEVNKVREGIQFKGLTVMSDRDDGRIIGIKDVLAEYMFVARYF